MNSIVIFGQGVCGTATAAIFNNDVDYYDPPKGLIIEDFSNYCYAIISVPTNGTETGLDYTDVEHCYEKLLRGGFNGIVLIRSTCDPVFLKRISEVYEKTVFWPEFLTEANSVNDALKPRLVVFGTEDSSLIEHIEKLLIDYGHAQHMPWHITDIKSAGLIKLGINTALSSKVTMFNSLYDISEKHGCDWEAVRWAITSDERIGRHHTSVPGPDGKRGFGGKCLQKDSNALAKLDETNVYLDSIRQYNKTIRPD